MRLIHTPAGHTTYHRRLAIRRRDRKHDIMRELYHIPASTRDRVYDFIRVYQFVHKMPPTLREVADGVGLRSLSGVQWHLNRLIEEGRLYERDGRISRNLRLRDRDAAPTPPTDTAAAEDDAPAAPAPASPPKARIVH